MSNALIASVALSVEMERHMTSAVIAILTFVVIASVIVFATDRLAELRATDGISRRLQALSRSDL
jgi:hypothetical protein